MKSSVKENLDAQMKFFNLAICRSLSKLFEESLLNAFVAVDEPGPNDFVVTIGAFVKINADEKQLVLFSKPEGSDAQAVFQRAIFDTVTTLAGAALNVTQLELQAQNKLVPAGLRLSYDALTSFSYWEPVYEDERALNAGQWIRELMAQDGG